MVNNNAHIDIYNAITCFQSVLLLPLCGFQENQIWNTPQEVLKNDYVWVGLQSSWATAVNNTKYVY